LTLERNPKAEGTIKFEWGKALKGAEVYLDGERVEPKTVSGGEASDTLTRQIQTKSGRHLIEVLADGHRPWSRIVDIAPGTTIVEPVDPNKTELTIGVDSDEPATIRIDGVGRGSVPVMVEDLSPLKAHHLEVNWSEDSWETALAFPKLGTEVIKVGTDDLPESVASEDVAYLKISTGKDWWPIFIDGAATGLTTPVMGDRKIPVTPGSHRITFRRGQSSHQTRVELESGEQKTLDKNVEFSWTP
jgi:hypothetical protein